METIQIVIINNAKPPMYTNGIHKMYASESGVVPPKVGAKISVGFRIKIPENCFGKIQSSTVRTLGGVVDSDYRGEICAIVYNDTEESFVYEKGDEVAEMAICEISTPEIEVVGY